MNRIIPLLLCCLLFASGALHASGTLESFKFATSAEELRFKHLIAELRCLVCQNQSLADSDAELAHDLRVEVYEMLQAGNTNEQIAEFLVERYGDFVLYNPPVKPSTWLIWFGPFVVLIIAMWLLFRALGRQRTATRQEISAEQRKQLEQALHHHPGEDTKS